MEDKKTVFRMADIIQQALIKLRKQRHLESLNKLAKLVSQFKELGSESKKLGLSLKHNWLLAANRCCNRTSRLLDDISYSVSSVKHVVKEPKKKTPKLSTLVEDLNQLQDEFGDIEFDGTENTISVETDPITLDDLYLGPFRIQLELDRFDELYEKSIYRVIALNPHPSATSEEVTHPHVSDEKLCEGDGAASLRTALKEGRLCDFFAMVRSTLNTYNPDSPYISLDDWCGMPCYDCGYIMDSESAYYCCFCQNDYCEQCSACCQLCDEIYCLGCGVQCSYCEETFCPNCISNCSECGGLCCQNCLEDRLCPDCKEESEVEEDETRENDIAENKAGKDKNQPEAKAAEVELTS